MPSQTFPPCYHLCAPAQFPLPEACDNLRNRSSVANSRPPVALLWEKYSYSPFTGRFYRKTDGREIKGNFVGYGRSHQLSINAKYRFPYGVCVYAWLFGEWPEKGEEVDHLDHDPFNHRPWNIRKVSKIQNLKNRRRCGNYKIEREKILNQFDASSIPESLRGHLKLSLKESSGRDFAKSIHKKRVYVNISAEQAFAIHKLNWPLPVVGVKEILPPKEPFRHNQTFSSPVYNSVISAIHEKPIHIGDIAILWITIISDKYPIHPFIYFCRRLSNMTQRKIAIKDGYLSLA